MEPDFDMEQFIRQKLAGMKSLEEKQLLRDILGDVFLPLHHQTEKYYEALRQRVRDDVLLSEDNYAIYTSVMSPQELAVPHNFLRPMLSADLESHTPALEADTSVLDTLYWEQPYPDTQKIIRANPSFPGIIKTDKGDIPAIFMLQWSRRYLEKLYQLYRIFLLNQIPWRTVCAPLLYHFYDLIPLHAEAIPKNSSYLGYQSDFLEIHGIGNERRIPVWNLETIPVKIHEFPEPALDKVNYEYRIMLSDLAQGSYLAASGTLVLAARRERDTLILVSSSDGQLHSELIRLIPYLENAADKIEAPIFTNCPKKHFAGRLVSWYQQNIKTRAELQRLLAEMGAQERYILRETEVVPYAIEGETYISDTFLIDEIRDPAISKTLLLSFERKAECCFYDHDLISYYCTVIQQIYPEYHVHAALLDCGTWNPKEHGEGVAL